MSTWSAFQPLPSFASGPVADVGNLYNRQAVAVISDPPIVQFWVASSTGRQPLPMYIVALRSVSHRSQRAASCVPRVRHHIRRGFRPSSGHVVDTVLHSDKVHNSFDTCELPAVTAICLRTARLRDMSWLRGRYGTSYFTGSLRLCPQVLAYVTLIWRRGMLGCLCREASTSYRRICASGRVP